MRTKKELLKICEALYKTPEETRSFLGVPRGTWNAWMNGQNADDYIISGLKARVEVWLVNELKWQTELAEQKFEAAFELLYADREDD